MWSEPRRAHPMGVLLYAWRYMAGFGALAIFAPTLVADPAVEGARFVQSVVLVVALVALALVGVALFSWAQWRRFTFCVQGGSLMVEQGLLIRKSTRLTPERIQSVDTRANLLFRVLGLVSVDIHTAARGQAAEVSIPALTEAEAQGLAEVLRPQGRVVGSESEVGSTGGDASEEREQLQGSPAPSVAVSTAEPSWRLTTPELGIVVLISNAGIVGIGLLAGLISMLAAVAAMSPALTETFREWLALQDDLFGFFGVVMILGLAWAWLAGSVTTALRYWDFSTTRTGGQLRVAQGLLQRTTRNVPLDRIQALRFSEGPLAQAIGRVWVSADCAGIGIATVTEIGPTVIHPLLRREDVSRFSDLMVPGYDAPPLSPLPIRARRRYLFRAVVPWMLISIVLSAVVPLGWISLVFVFVAIGWALLAFSDAAWGVSGDVLGLRWRGLGRTTALVRRRRVQAISVSQHPLQRIAGLATLSVRVAASPGVAVFKVRHLDESDALAVMDWVSFGVSRFHESV